MLTHFSILFDMFETFFANVWDMFGGHVWDVFGMCFGHVWGDIFSKKQQSPKSNITGLGTSID